MLEVRSMSWRVASPMRLGEAQVYGVGSYAEIYAALTSGHAHLGRRGIEDPSESIPGVGIRPCLPADRETFDLPARGSASEFTG